MGLMRRVYFKINLFIINKFLCGVHFFKFKRMLLRASGIEIGYDTKIVGPLILNTSNIKIGAECWIGRNFTVDGNGQVIIGDRCDFAPEVLISTGSHKIGDLTRRAGEGVNRNTIIGNGTWIGTRATIIEGSNIGNSSIIGACSLVNKSFEDNVVIAGIPAKRIKQLDGI